MPLSNNEMNNKVRGSVASLLEESFGSIDRTGLTTLCVSVEANLIDTLKWFISGTLGYGAPLTDSKAISHSSAVCYLDDVYSIRIIPDMFNPVCVNILVFPSGLAQSSFLKPIKKKIRGNGRFSELSVFTNSQLAPIASLLAVLAKATFEAGYSWLEDRVHQFLSTLHTSNLSDKNLSEDIGRFIRTVVGERISDRVWFMVSTDNSSTLALDYRKRKRSMDIFIRHRTNYDHSPLSQLVALSTTVLPFEQTLTFKALQEKGSLSSRFLDAPYAKPATPFMRALQAGFESDIAYVDVLTPDSELIVALGCPDSLKTEVTKYIPQIREGIKRIVANRATEFRESLEIASSHSMSLRSEAAEVAGAFNNSLVSSVTAEPKLIFISYSHADERHKDNITKHLYPLIRARQGGLFGSRSVSRYRVGLSYCCATGKV